MKTRMVTNTPAVRDGRTFRNDKAFYNLIKLFKGAELVFKYGLEYKLNTLNNHSLTIYYKTDKYLWYPKSNNIFKFALKNDKSSFPKTINLNISLGNFIESLNLTNIHVSAGNYVMPYGKYFNQTIKDIPMDYLEWVISQKPSNNMKFLHDQIKEWIANNN